MYITRQVRYRARGREVQERDDKALKAQSVAAVGVKVAVALPVALRLVLRLEAREPWEEPQQDLEREHHVLVARELLPLGDLQMRARVSRLPYI